MPRPGTRVIPDRWSEHHRPTAVSTMTDTVRLYRPASGSASTFDEQAGRSVYPLPTLLGTFPARVQRLPRRAGGVEVGDRPVEIQLYQVSTPVDAPLLNVNDQVVPTVAPNDVELVGVILRVREAHLGSQLWQRDYLCEEVTPVTR